MIPMDELPYVTVFDPLQRIWDCQRKEDLVRLARADPSLEGIGVYGRHASFFFLSPNGEVGFGSSPVMNGNLSLDVTSYQLIEQYHIERKGRGVYVAIKNNKPLLFRQCIEFIRKGIEKHDQPPLSFIGSGIEKYFIDAGRSIRMEPRYLKTIHFPESVALENVSERFIR